MADGLEDTLILDFRVMHVKSLKRNECCSIRTHETRPICVLKITICLPKVFFHADHCTNNGITKI